MTIQQLSKIGLLLLGLTSAALAAPVFTWTDDEGQVHFTDKPIDLSVDLISVKSDPTDVDAIVEAREKENMSEEELSEEERQQRVADRLEQERQQVREENCRIAQENYDKLNTPRRLYEESADGERRYLESEEIDDRREYAASQVAEWCDN